MVKACIVKDCNSTYYPGSHIVYHPFPKQESRRALWLSILPLKRRVHDNARVCNLHFTRDNYDSKHNRIKPTAVPYYFAKRDPLSLDHEGVGESSKNLPKKSNQHPVKSNGLKSSNSKINESDPFDRLKNIIKPKSKDGSTPTARKKTTAVLKTVPKTISGPNKSITGKNKTVGSDDGQIYKVDIDSDKFDSDDEDDMIDNDDSFDSDRTWISSEGDPPPRKRRLTLTRKPGPNDSVIVRRRDTESDEEFNPIPSFPLLTPIKRKKGAKTSTPIPIVKVTKHLSENNEVHSQSKQLKPTEAGPKPPSAQRDSTTNVGNTDVPVTPHVTAEDSDDDSMDIEKKIKASTVHRGMKPTVSPARAPTPPARKIPIMSPTSLPTPPAKKMSITSPASPPYSPPKKVGRPRKRERPTVSPTTAPTPPLKKAPIAAPVNRSETHSKPRLSLNRGVKPTASPSMPTPSPSMPTPPLKKMPTVSPANPSELKSRPLLHRGPTLNKVPPMSPASPPVSSTNPFVSPTSPPVSPGGPRARLRPRRDNQQGKAVPKDAIVTIPIKEGKESGRKPEPRVIGYVCGRSALIQPAKKNRDPNEMPCLDKRELKLRLVTTVEDGPMYEIVSEDESDLEEDFTTQSTELPPRKLDDQYWKQTLTHILHNARFCGACLCPDGDSNLLSDDFEILINGTVHTKKLGDIAEVVFKDTDNLLASSQICNSCTTHLIQSYIFIENTRQTSKMLNYHLNELYNKTCYIKNDVLNDEETNIHNVVFSLNTSEEKQIEINVANENQQTAKIHDYKRLVPREYECIECDIILPTEKEWDAHKITHKHNHRCRICNILCKTPELLSKHFALHFKSKCRICNGLVQDGGLLSHLKKCHGNVIKLCRICNVVFYSKTALDSHNDLWHINGCDTKCEMCLRSYTEKELVKHKCRFKCPECSEVPCVHHKYLMSYREQILNLSIRAKCPDCHFSTVSKEGFMTHVIAEHTS